jgi:hypothetical protein
VQNEASIIRKIAALLARAADEASSPAEVGHAIHVAHKLMEQHNLTLDEVLIRHEEVRRSEFAVDPKDSRYANIMVTAIARLAQCRAQGERGTLDHYTFIGLRVDVEYAEWLMRASSAALARGWNCFRSSQQFAALGQNHDQSSVERHYKLGFSVDLARRIKALADADQTRNALVVLKGERIDAELGAAGAQMSTNALVAVQHNLSEAFQSGAEASRDVPLRHQIDEQGSTGG